MKLAGVKGRVSSKLVIITYAIKMAYYYCGIYFL